MNAHPEPWSLEWIESNEGRKRIEELIIISNR